MSSEHRRPLAALVVVLIAASVILVQGLRAQAVELLVHSGAPRGVVAAVAPALGQSMGQSVGQSVGQSMGQSMGQASPTTVPRPEARDTEQPDLLGSKVTAPRPPRAKTPVTVPTAPATSVPGPAPQRSPGRVSVRVPTVRHGQPAARGEHDSTVVHRDRDRRAQRAHRPDLHARASWSHGRKVGHQIGRGVEQRRGHTTSKPDRHDSHNGAHRSDRHRR